MPRRHVIAEAIKVIFWHFCFANNSIKRRKNMHMADALLSPQVGAVMAAVSIGAIAYSVKKISREESFDEKKIPVMAVSGAFIFAAQMINFTIPGTGASGHIGGGLLLAALLGPLPALLTMAAVLIIQCLFFADGGLLALGANIFNLGVVISFIAFPLIYKPIMKSGFSRIKIFIASMLAVVVGLQIGSFGVVVETIASDITQMPFNVFLLLMQPIHLAIGIVEGLITAGILNFIYSMRPEILESAIYNKKIGQNSIKKVIIVMIILALIIGGGISIFASSMPDGLEWAIEKIIGVEGLDYNGGIYSIFGQIQEKSALMPDYEIKGKQDIGTSMAGIVGGIITLLLAGITGLAISIFKKRKLDK